MEQIRISLCHLCAFAYDLLFISRIPLLGEFTCQNAIMAERFIEAGSAYVSASALFTVDST